VQIRKASWNIGQNYYSINWNQLGKFLQTKTNFGTSCN